MDYEQIGDYFFYLNPIGNGSFSTIYKGYRITDKLPIAVKKITKIIDKKYINSEIDLMKKINSKYIIKLFDVIHYKNHLYLFLEYCNQGDLSKYIYSNNSSYDEEYIYQIIKGLQCLFNSKIIHRDIKPHNILIKDNVIKISDFGFAKTFNDNDLISTFCGSPLYMAPEILKLKEYTNKADIWSLGVIVFEIIFKKHPYPSKNKAELIKHLKNNTKINIPHIDEKLKDLLEKLLEKNEYTRITWDDVFSHPWFVNYNSSKNTFVNKINDLDFNILFEDTCDHGEINDDKLYKSTEDIKRIRFISMDNDIISQSTYIDKSEKPTINVSEDSKVYSKSAPHKNYFLENYINQKSDITESSSDYNILGKSPINNDYNIYNYLHKSVNTLKNFFNYK